MAEEASEDKVATAYKVLRALEEESQGKPVPLSVLLTELKSREKTSELGGDKFLESEVVSTLLTLARRNLVHEASEGNYSTYLEPEDVEGQSEFDSEGPEALLDFGRTIGDLDRPMKRARMYLGVASASLILIGFTLALYVAAVSLTSPLDLVVEGFICAAIVMTLGALAFRNVETFNQFEELGADAQRFVDTVGFEMAWPSGDDTAQRILNQLRLAGRDSKSLDNELTTHPDLVKFNHELAGKSGKKYRFDVVCYKPSNGPQRWLRRNFSWAERGLFLLVRVYQDEVTEANLSELREGVIDIVRLTRDIPTQIVVVSQTGFTRRAYGWVNREANVIRVLGNYIQRTPVELVQETPSKTFKIVG